MVSIDSLKRRASRLKTEVHALYLAYRDPRVPWYAKVWAACVIAYAFSPIDLIPDPIPILGYLDDLILIPLGITLAIRMIPPEVMAECRQRAQLATGAGRRSGWIAAGVIVALWLTALGLVTILLWRMVSS